jgi:hypothetical protein
LFGHALMYAPSHRSNSALIAKTWLEIAPNLSESRCISAIRIPLVHFWLYQTVVRLSSTGLITPQTYQRLSMSALLTQFCVHSEKSRCHHNTTQNRPEPKTLLTELPYC